MQRPARDVFEEFVRLDARGCFREGGRDKHATVIVRPADEDLFPRLGMSRSEVVAVGEFIDFRRRQVGEDVSGKVAEERVTQSVDAFKVLEEQNEPLEMRGAELAVDAVKRMRDGMGDRFLLEERLKIENILAQTRNLRVLRFGKAPNEQINFTRILRKISRNLLADKCISESK